MGSVTLPGVWRADGIPRGGAQTGGRNHEDDWSQAKRAIFPQLKPSTKTISLRLPESMLNELRLLANKRDVPYQSLIKIILQERIDQELYRRIGS